jgi:multicomponent Na+:H+ antiporter subunit G
VDQAIEYFSGFCLLAGVLLALIGAIGVLRLPDALTQLHAAELTDTLGAALIIVGLVLQSGASLLSVKLLILLLFLLFTNPTSSHSLARAVRHYRIRPWKHPAEVHKQSDSKVEES